MNPRRVSIPLALLAVLTCGSFAFFIYFGKDFPPTMAVYFGDGGRADGYMDRVKFIVLGSFLSFMLPTLIATLVGVLPRVLPQTLISLPNKDYWLAPERREEAFNVLLWFGLWLACLVQAFLLFVHVGIYEANLTQPPSPGAAGSAVALPAVLFAGAVIGWGVALGRAFARPRANLR